MLTSIVYLIRILMVPVAFTIFTIAVTKTDEWKNYERHPEEYDDFFKPIWEDADYDPYDETEGEY